MDRRSLLATVAALLTARSGIGREADAATRTTATSAAPATGESGTRTGAADGRAGMEVADAGPRTSSPDDGSRTRAVTRLRAARGTLREVPATFEAEFDRVEYLSQSPEFDGGPVESLLDDARDDLAAAAGVATGDRERAVDALREYVELYERLLAVTDPLVANRPPLSGFAPADGYGEAKKRLGRTRRWLESVRQSIELAWVGFRTARMELAEPETVALAQAREALERFDAFVDGLETGLDGDSELLQGWEKFEYGMEDFRDDRVRLAVLSFRQAEARFHRAERLYVQAESVGPEKLAPLFRSRQCRGRNYQEAAAEVRYGVTLEDNDPDRAAEYRSDGEAAVDGDCH